MGLSPCRSVPQHSTVTHCRNRNLTTAKLCLPIISRPGSEVSQSRIHTSIVPKETFHTQTQTGALQSSIQLSNTAFNHFPPDRSAHRSPRDPSDPCVKDRHTFLQALEAFFHVFATRSRQHLHGNSLVHLKFSTPWFRCILPTSSTLRKRLPSTRELSIFFFEKLTWQRLISVSHLFVLFARIPLGWQWRMSQGRTYSSLPYVLLPSLPINLPTSGRQCHSQCPCTATPSLKQTSAKKHLVAPSSSHGRTTRQQSSLSAERL